MALSGSFTSGSVRPYIQVNWSATQNIGANTSTVTANVYLIYDVINLPGGNTCKYYFGDEYQYSSFEEIISSTTTVKSKLLGTFTKTVTHNPNGTYICDMIIDTYAPNAVPIRYVRKEIVLDTIEPKSTLNQSVSIIADSDPIYIYPNITVSNTDYTHVLQLYDGATLIPNQSYTITPYYGTNTMTVTLTAAQRTSLLSYMADKQQLVATLKLTTYEGSNVIGTSSVSAVINTYSDSSKPIFTDVSFCDYYYSTASITGNDQILIQDYSKLRVICAAATARNGATIVSYSAVCGNKSKSGTSTTIDLDQISTSGNLELTVTATDSKGYSTSVKRIITVTPYTKPKISSYNLSRANGVDATIQLAFNGQISDILVGGTNKNSITSIKYRYKKTSEISYGNYVSLLSAVAINGNSFSYSSLESFTLDVNFSYNVQVLIQDSLVSLTEYTQDIIVPQGTPLMSFRKDKVGINNNNPQHPLDVGGDIGMNGHIVHGFVRKLATTGEDFNNLVDGGYYLYYLFPMETACTNAPATQGILEVFASSYIIIQRFTSVTNAIYVRTRGINETWSSWTTI